MMITVTQEDIDTANHIFEKARLDGTLVFRTSTCPVWQALHRMYPDRDITVGPARVYLADKYYSCSNALFTEIMHYDKWGKMSPGDYEITRTES